MYAFCPFHVPQAKHQVHLYKLTECEHVQIACFLARIKEPLLCSRVRRARNTCWCLFADRRRAAFFWLAKRCHSGAQYSKWTVGPLISVTCAPMFMQFTGCHQPVQGFYRVFACDVMAAMLVYLDKRILNIFFWMVHQHGRQLLCCFNPQGLSENALLVRKCNWLAKKMLITCVMRNARAHKLQWSGPTVHSSTVSGAWVCSCLVAIINLLLSPGYYIISRVPTLCRGDNKWLHGILTLNWLFGVNTPFNHRSSSKKTDTIMN